MHAVVYALPRIEQVALHHRLRSLLVDFGWPLFVYGHCTALPQVGCLVMMMTSWLHVAEVERHMYTTDNHSVNSDCSIDIVITKLEQAKLH